jgi:hypothetical protein
MFREAAMAVERQQPGVTSLVEAQLRASTLLPTAPAPEQPAALPDGGQALLVAAKLGSPEQSTQPPVAAKAAAHGGPPQGQASESVAVDISNGTDSPAAAGGPPASSTATAALPAIDRPCSEVAHAPRGGTQATERLCRWLDRTGLGQPQLRPGLHLALSMVLAGPFVVVFAVFKALDYKSSWVVITVNSVFERCLGNVRSRVINRALGTVVGMFWAAACIGFPYLANGRSWSNSATK